MTTCTSCGNDVTGKKFCPQCGTPVQLSSTPAGTMPFASATTCPRCNGEVKPGAAFCTHCGSALSTSSSVFCASCGMQNAPGMRFCTSCGSPIGAAATPAQQPNYMRAGQYQQPAPYSQPQQYSQSQSQQPYGQPQYSQQYGQAGYQSQPMIGRQPMVLRCPVCMAMAPLGTPNCPSCHTSLAGVIPTPASMPAQGQQGGLGGFLQGNNGKMAMGALGGAAAVIGGEMLLHGIENAIEGDIEGDMGYGQHHHRHHHRDEGMLGDLGDIAKDIGLF